jgi:drug/metabolite transporter (DMT)-like permease
MVVAALLFEPGAREALAGDWGQEAWLSWLFLVILGSLVSYTFYLTLVRDWGASRAGTYAFISPAIAVVLGAILLDERVRALDVVAMVIMGVAAWLALRDKTDLPVPQPASLLKPREESAT